MANYIIKKFRVPTDSEVNPSKISCYICGNEVRDLSISINNVTAFSGLSIEDLLSTFIKLDEGTTSVNSLVCRFCYTKINDLDEHMTEAEKMKSEFSSIYNQTRYGVAMQEVKDEKEIDISVIKQENIFTETQYPKDDEEHPIDRVQPVAKTICYEKRLQPKQSSSFIITTIDDEREKAEKLKEARYKTREHIEITMDDDKRIFSCKICQKTFINRRTVRLHVLRHLTTERNLICQQCGMAYKSKTAFKKHLKRHADIKKYGCAQKLTCDLCGKQFLEKRFLSEHMQAVHLRIKNFSCHVCGSRFARIRGLREHLSIHEGDPAKKFPCDICQKRFKSTFHLRIHKTTHTEERKFPCEMCDKVFKSSKYAREHTQSVHLGVRRNRKYPCDFCGKNFERPKPLRRHLWKVHEKNEYASEFK